MACAALLSSFAAADTSTHDFCGFLAKEFPNDPFIEREFWHCQALEVRLNRDNPVRHAQRWERYCAEIGDARLAGDIRACKAADKERRAQNQKIDTPVSSTLAKLELTKLPSYCDYVGSKYNKTFPANDVYPCYLVQNATDLSNPAQWMSDYRAYCNSLAPHFPDINQAELFHYCHDISVAAIKAKNEVYQAEKRREKLKAQAIEYGSWGLGIIVAVGVLGWTIWHFATLTRRQQKARARQIAARSKYVIVQIGANEDVREKIITEQFDRKEGTVEFIENYFGDGSFDALTFRLQRSLATMEPDERTALRAVYMLYNRGLIPAEAFDFVRFGIIYSQGRGTIIEAKFTLEDKADPKPMDGPSAIDLYARYRGLTSANSAVSFALSLLDEQVSANPDHPTVKLLHKKVSGGSTWLTAEDVPNSAFKAVNHPYTLLLGTLPDGTPLEYGGEGAMITVAPPGSGKTQAHVLPALLEWPGAALVLDVKGELYAKTAQWRAENVGPVFKFAPLDPENSHFFNPLALVRGDRFHVWEDSAYLAEMIVVQNPGGEKFWDSRARGLLTGIIAYACYDTPVEQRSMNKLHAVANRVNWDEFVSRLCSTREVSSMMEEGESLDKIEEKTLDGVLQTLKNSLHSWAGERVREVTKRSDWSPLDLRGPSKPTIYISLKAGEIDAFASVLRVFVGMHIRALTADLPPRGSPPILFMLDEMPRLKYMPPIEEALETGRQYGLRLWMFAQSLGQLRLAYKNADGMIGSCAVQAYMNPSGHDGTAERICKQIGMAEGALTGQRKNIIEPAELTGPDYEYAVIVFGVSSKPAAVRKVLAFDEAYFRERMPEPEAVS